MTPEDRASNAMAECIAKNKGENMAFYLAQAIREAMAEERERCADCCHAIIANPRTNYSKRKAAREILTVIRSAADE